MRLVVFTTPLRVSRRRFSSDLAAWVRGALAECGERLGQVVVGASLEPFHTRLLPARAESMPTGTVRVRFVHAQCAQEGRSRPGSASSRRSAPGRAAPAAPPPAPLLLADDLHAPALAEQPPDVLAHVGVVVREQDARPGMRLSVRHLAVAEPVRGEQRLRRALPPGQPAQRLLDVGGRPRSRWRPGCRGCRSSRGAGGRSPSAAGPERWTLPPVFSPTTSTPAGPVRPEAAMGTATACSGGRCQAPAGSGPSRSRLSTSHRSVAPQRLGEGPGRGAVERGALRRSCQAALDPDAGGETHSALLRVGEVDERERHVARVLGQAFGAEHARLGHGTGAAVWVTGRCK